MNEKKDNKLAFIFTPIPFVLLRAYDLLTKNDRDLLVQIASFGPNGCFFSVDKITEKILVCGEPAFYRSVYKLKHLKLIKFKRGNRKMSNRYFFETDPRNWRLTEDLHKKIQEDAGKLGISDLKFNNEPFPNVFGFVTSFNICYPSYKIENSKKIKNSQENYRQPVVEDDSYLQITKWQNRIEQMERSKTTFLIIKNYNYFSQNITAYKAWKDGMLNEYSATETEKRYIKALIDKFELIAKNPKSEFEKQCFVLMEALLNDGKSGFEIEGALLKLKNRYDQETTLQAPVDGDPEK